MGFSFSNLFGGSEDFRLEKKRIKQENKTARVVAKQDTKQTKYVTRSASGGETDLDKVLGAVDGVASNVFGGGDGYDSTGLEEESFIEEAFGSNQNAAIAGVIGAVLLIVVLK